MTESTWELVKVTDEIKSLMRPCDIYTIINRRIKSEWHKHYHADLVTVRVDIMDRFTDNPLISFESIRPPDLRKAVMQWIDKEGYILDADHAGYIGYEIQRAFAQAHYVQA